MEKTCRIDLGPFQSFKVSIRPHDHEQFHLHILLHVCCATWHDSLKSVNGIVHNTFREACVARGLIADNQLLPRQLRRISEYLLVFSNVIDLLQIWDEFHDNFCKDYTHCGLGRDAAYLTDVADTLSVFSTMVMICKLSICLIEVLL